MPDLNLIVAPSAALIGVAITIYGQALVARRNRVFELQKERLKAAHESTEKRLWLVRERLERLHLILGEIGREFSLTFMTVDWEAGIKRAEHHAKYRLLCSKLEEAQMIADLYVQALSEPLVKLESEMSCYWGYFGQVLHLEQQGKKVDHTTGCFEESVKCAHSIPRAVAAAQREIRRVAEQIMNPHTGT